MRSERRRSRGRGGFTLLEVLMAVAIFAFASIGLLMALQTSLAGAQATQRDSQVQTGLSNRLARYSVGPMRAVEEDEAENDVNYHIQVGREEVTNEDRALLRGFWRISVTASWTDDGGPQEWTASHLVYRSDG
ncbi:MAG TPA: prepilin-type N-terminal cleavage/methylation domain-containing protein [Chthoniobacterales bacterium]|jgi:type II secretion system protein I